MLILHTAAAELFLEDPDHHAQGPAARRRGPDDGFTARTQAVLRQLQVRRVCMGCPGVVELRVGSARETSGCGARGCPAGEPGPCAPASLHPRPGMSSYRRYAETVCPVHPWVPLPPYRSWPWWRKAGTAAAPSGGSCRSCHRGSPSRWEATRVRACMSKAQLLFPLPSPAAAAGLLRPRASQPLFCHPSYRNDCMM